MKDDVHPEGERGSSAGSLPRAVFCALAGALGLGIVLLVAGIASRQLHWTVAGIFTLGLVWAGRVWWQRREQTISAERVLSAALSDGPPLDDGRVRELLALLDAWETLEQQRGSANFDPWALQTLRNDIRRAVDSDPALGQLFSSLQRAA